MKSFNTIVAFIPVLVLYIFMFGLLGATLFSNRLTFDEHTDYVVSWQPTVYDQTSKYEVCL